MKIINITNDMKQKYINLYKKTYSVSEVMRICDDGVGRGRIVKILKDEGIYEGLNGENYLKKKAENHEKIMLEKYGVTNWGQTEEGGYRKLNKVPYKKVSYLTDEYNEYRMKVDKLTKKNIKRYYKNNLPKYCEYTGILFADEEGPTNPNDPRKRSVDHRIPIIHCFLNNMPIEEVASTNNIVFVLKYVNSIKAQSTEESILPIMEKVRKAFINEGFSCKEDFEA